MKSLQPQWLTMEEIISPKEVMRGRALKEGTCGRRYSPWRVTTTAMDMIPGAGGKYCTPATLPNPFRSQRTKELTR